MIKDVALSYKPDGTLNYRYGSALVFVLNTGLREGELLALSKNGIQHLDRILRKCEVPHYGTHALRHTFATKLLSKKTSHQDIKAVDQL